MLNSNTNLPWAPSTWKVWVDYIMKHRNSFGVQRAALIRQNGITAAASCGYLIPQKDIMHFPFYFAMGSLLEKIQIKGKTFVVKFTDGDLIIAFNGAKYIFISRSNTMFLVVKIKSKNRICSEKAAKFVRKINNKLIEKDF